MHKDIIRTRFKNALGVLWIIAGLLEFQPHLFTAQFITAVVDPTKIAQPDFILAPINFFSGLFLLHTAIFNLAIALGQLGIGIMILVKKTQKVGLGFSVIWGLFVWYIGEGMGGIFSQHASLLTGFPGAAIIYVVIALATWPTKSAGLSKLFDGSVVYTWLLVWAGGALLNLETSPVSSHALGHILKSSANNLPGLLGSPITHLGSFVMAQGNWLFWSLIGVEALIGFAIFLPSWLKKPLLYMSLCLLIVFWIAGQNMGGLFSGTATDLNCAPALFLLGLMVIFSPSLKIDLFGEKV